MKLRIDPITIIIAGLIFGSATLAVETNVPAVSEFGDKYLSNKEGE